MGLFNRKSKEDNVQLREATQTEPTESYTVPVGLDFLTPYLSKGEATAISTFFGGVQLISNTIASIPIHVRDYKSGDIISHPVDIALESSIQSKFTLMKQLIWDLYIHGNGICYIKRASDGTPVELVYAPHGSCSIIYNEAFPKKLYYLFPNITTKKVEPINVIHLVLNSKDGVQGKGLPIYAKKLLDIALATDTHAKNYFENGANIDGILKSTKPLSSNQKLDIKQSWQQVHGQGKSGGIAVVGGDMDYIPIGTNANDSEMIESRKFNAEEVCRYLCIDPILLGVSGASSYNSIEQAQLSFLSHCIYPLISLIESEFNRKFLKPSERGKFYIDFDENHIMFADKSSTANYYATLVKNGIMTINEARHNLGYTPVDGGDKPIIPFTDLTQNTLGGEDKNTKENEDE
jgi:HK97 family phage portal protein